MLRVGEFYALVSVTRWDIDIGVGERYRCHALGYTCYSLVSDIDVTRS